MNKPLETHEPIVRNSWAIFSTVAQIFSGVIIVLSGDAVIEEHHRRFGLGEEFMAAKLAVDFLI